MTVDTVPDEGIAGADDAAVRQATQQSGRFLLPQGLDFSDIRRYEPGAHHGLLLVRLRNPSAAALGFRIQTIFENEDIASWQRCFVVVTDRKTRVRRPD